ncbi:hypothetical protein F511_02442 [Dorcoceras hygrometricum]|nr:hypothetical protein F511_02442 [Dorcoceras hygrometricum]
MACLLSMNTSSSITTNLNINLPSVNKFAARVISIFNSLSGLQIVAKKDRYKKKDLLVVLAVKDSKAIAEKTEKNNVRTFRKGDKGLIFSEGRDKDENYGPICPGCGVFMQNKDQNLPGYYQKRMEVVEVAGDEEEIENFDEFEEDDEDFEDDVVGELDDSETEGSDLESGEFGSELEDLEDDYMKELDGFTPAGVGYGNITEETIEKVKRERVSKAERKRMARDAQKEKEEVTVCARCHSLRYYGQVKNQMAENLIPDFDFDKLISKRLMKPTGNADATVLIMVVDCVDFDGSFPKCAARSLFKAFEGGKDGFNHRKNLPKLVLVATKVDLLPSQISPTRLDRWVRHRAKANGAPKLSGVYLVSSRKDLGVRNLLAFVKDLAGPRGNVWVIGAQNAGKSTLINAFSKKEGVKITRLTEAAVPGTTLGILRIGGILSAKAKMYDTPGLLHPYLMAMRLNRDEQKMVEIRQAIHVGGLVRLDLNQATVDTIYVTVFFSPSVSLHLGKLENAVETKSNHAGVRLQPPIGTERVSELGAWENRDINATGTSWDVNSIDIAVAGLGWFSLGLKGQANLSLWTYEGIQITLRDPLVLDRAPSLERPGFWLPKAISDAIASQSKLEAKSRKIEEERRAEFHSDIPS